MRIKKGRRAGGQVPTSSKRRLATFSHVVMLKISFPKSVSHHREIIGFQRSFLHNVTSLPNGSRASLLRHKISRILSSTCAFVFLPENSALSQLETHTTWLHTWPWRSAKAKSRRLSRSFMLMSVGSLSTTVFSYQIIAVAYTQQQEKLGSYIPAYLYHKTHKPTIDL